MKIKSKATPDELSSPFYKTNEDFCRKFENYIASKNGKVKGNYNAWSYFVQGKIIISRPWYLKYKKATYASPGHLFLSSKKQCLFISAEWSCEWASSQNSEFQIRRKNRFNFIERLFKKDLKQFELEKNYSIRGAENNTTLIEKLSYSLKPLFNSREIYSIILENNKLTISLRTEEHYFDFFEKISSL